MAVPGAGCGGPADRLRAIQAQDVATKIRPETASLWEALREVLDPEIPVSVVDLGLICDIRRANARVEVDVTFTSTACPAVTIIKEDIERRLMAESDVDEVHVEEAWEVNWTASRISGCGKAEMKRYGITL